MRWGLYQCRTGSGGIAFFLHRLYQSLWSKLHELIHESIIIGIRQYAWLIMSPKAACAGAFNLYIIQLKYVSAARLFSPVAKGQGIGAAVFDPGNGIYDLYGGKVEHGLGGVAYFSAGVFCELCDLVHGLMGGIVFFEIKITSNGRVKHGCLFSCGIRIIRRKKLFPAFTPFFEFCVILYLL